MPQRDRPEVDHLLDERSKSTDATQRHRVKVLVALLVVAVALVLALTHRLIDADRTKLVDEFAAQRLEYVEIVAKEVGDNLNDILHDLQFASPLLASAGGTEERRRILQTLVTSERGYVAAVLIEGETEPSWAYDPRVSQLSNPTSSRMVKTTRDVLAVDAHPSPLETSGTVVDDQDHSLRVFAVRFETAAGAEIALGLLVDVEFFLEPLRLISSEPQTHLLIVGPRQVPSPASDERLAESFRREAKGGLAPLVREMKNKRSGTLRISGSAPDLEQLGSSDYVAAFASIPGVGAHNWSIATLTSLSRLRAHERQLMWRLYTVALVIVVMLVLFGSYVVRSFRRRVTLQERLRSAWEIAHLNEKSDKILERIPATVLVLSNDRRITDVNHPVGQRTEEQFVGEDLFSAFPDADEETSGAIRAVFEEAMQNGRPRHLLQDGVDLFGERRHYNVYAVPLETGSDDASGLLVFEDITELRELENQLLHAEKLATVGELAAGIAHEVGTPLGVARGRAEYLREKLDEDDSRRKHVDIVIDQIDRVRRIIESMLDFSRKRPARIHPVDLEEVVAELADLLRIELGQADVTLECDVPSSLPTLAADRDQLQQVLTNIVMNARDASASGDVVTIAARDAGEKVAITVEDRGKGIPEHQRHRIFDPFFTTKKRGMGTGLGLWVAMQILRSHDARIDVDSSEQRGTTVRIQWPTWSSAHGRPSEPAEMEDADDS